MHDYEFTISTPNAPSAPSVPAEPAAEPVKKSAAFDWMDDDEEEAPKSSKSDDEPFATSSAPFASSAPATKQKPLCKYGAACHQKNPEHHAKYSHPHLDKEAKPLCKYGAACHQKNPDHHAKFSHPHLEKAKSEVAPPEAPIKASTPASTEPTTSSAVSAPAPTTTLPKAPSAIVETPVNDLGKRPKPAIDLMDEEEEFLPPAKKAKLAASVASAAKKANGKSGAFDMSWMDTDEPAAKPSETLSRSTTPSPPPTTSEVKQANGKVVATKPTETSFGSETELEAPVVENASKASSSQKSDSRPPSSSQPSSSQAKTPSSTPASSQSLMPSASQPKQQKSASSSKSDIKGSSTDKSVVEVDSVEKLKEIVAGKIGETHRNAIESGARLPLRTVVLLPYLVSSDFVQEVLDITIEGATEYGHEEQTQLGSLIRASQSTTPVSSLATRFWFAPPAPSHAAAFRRRTMVPDDIDSDSDLLPVTSFIKMTPLNLTLADALQYILKEEQKFDRETKETENGSNGSQDLENAFNLIIINDSNWRFKGIGVRTSMAPQIFALADAALKSVAPSQSGASTQATTLQALTKAYFEVGEPGKAFPVLLPKFASRPNTAAELPHNTTKIIHVISPSLLDQDEGMPKDTEAKWRGSVLSAMASL